MAATLQGFRSLIENSPDVMFLVDAQGEVQYASASTITVLGYRPEEMVGQSSLDLIHPEDRLRSTGAFEAVVAKPAERGCWQTRLRRKDGTWIWVESTASNTLRDPEIQAIAVSHRDLNGRKTAESSSQKEADDLRQFVSRLAHDLKEPLRTLSTFSRLFLESREAHADAELMVQFIEEGATRMTSLVDDVLALTSGVVDARPEWVELQDAIHQAVQNLGHAIESSGAILTIEELPAMYGNAGRLVSLFQNLIANAVKYRGEAIPRIHVSAEARESDWIIRVQDNGIGIAVEDRARIFDPFVRLRRDTISGTGLGLAICKTVVEGWGGTICVESEPNSGSTFCFTLPASTQNALTSAALMAHRRNLRE